MSPRISWEKKIRAIGGPRADERRRLDRERKRAARAALQAEKSLEDHPADCPCYNCTGARLKLWGPRAQQPFAPFVHQVWEIRG